MLGGTEALVWNSHAAAMAVGANAPELAEAARRLGLDLHVVPRDASAEVVRTTIATMLELA